MLIQSVSCVLLIVMEIVSCTRLIQIVIGATLIELVNSALWMEKISDVILIEIVCGANCKWCSTDGKQSGDIGIETEWCHNDNSV